LGIYRNGKAVVMRTTRDYSSVMTMCVCGESFRASGDPSDVRTRERAWNAEHGTCVASKREGSKVFWLSFCDGTRPKGEQFLGVCLIEVSAAEADDAAVDVMLRFPLAQPGSEWLAAATRKAHQLGCNPGGEVACQEMPVGHPNLSRYQFGVLMDRATCERIDREIELAEAADAVDPQATR
jgi:hypothetical protein